MAPPAANQPPNLNGSPDSAPNLDAARDKEPVLDQLQRNASRELESPVMAEPRHRQPRPSSGFNPRSAGIWTADQRRAEATNMPHVPEATPNRNVGEEQARRDEIGEATFPYTPPLPSLPSSDRRQHGTDGRTSIGHAQRLYEPDGTPRYNPDGTRRLGERPPLSAQEASAQEAWAQRQRRAQTILRANDRVVGRLQVDGNPRHAPVAPERGFAATPVFQAEQVRLSDQAQTQPRTEVQRPDQGVSNMPSLRSQPEFYMTAVTPVDTTAGPLPDNAECTICLEPLTEDVVKFYACGHMFHTVCVLSWFDQSAPRTGKKRGTCPNCRHELYEPDPRYGAARRAPEPDRMVRVPSRGMIERSREFVTTPVPVANGQTGASQTHMRNYQIQLQAERLGEVQAEAQARARQIRDRMVTSATHTRPFQGAFDQFQEDPTPVAAPSAAGTGASISTSSFTSPRRSVVSPTQRIAVPFHGFVNPTRGPMSPTQRRLEQLLELASEEELRDSDSESDLELRIEEAAAAVRIEMERANIHTPPTDADLQTAILRQARTVQAELSASPGQTQRVEEEILDLDSESEEEMVLGPTYVLDSAPDRVGALLRERFAAAEPEAPVPMPAPSGPERESRAVLAARDIAARRPLQEAPSLGEESRRSESANGRVSVDDTIHMTRELFSVPSAYAPGEVQLLAPSAGLRDRRLAYMDGLRREHIELPPHQDSALASERLNNRRLIQVLEDHRQETERSIVSLEAERALLSDRVADITRQLNARLAQASNDGQKANTAPPQGGMAYHEDIPPLATVVPARLPAQQSTPPAASEALGSSIAIGQAERTDGELRALSEGLRDQGQQSAPTHERRVPNTTAASAEPIHQEFNLRADRPESPRLFGQRSRSPPSNLFGAATLARLEAHANTRPQPYSFTTGMRDLEELLEAGRDEAEEEEESEEDFSEEEEEEEEDFSEEEEEEEDFSEEEDDGSDFDDEYILPLAEANALRARLRPSG
jgi:hypothetical protein